MTSFKRTLRPLEQSVLFEIGVESDPTRVALPTRVAERPTKKARDRRDVFNGRLLDGLTLVGPHDIPKIDACSLVPERLIAFTEASKMGQPDPQAWVHAHEDDYKTERFWASPEQYFKKFRGFAGVISPDYSTYRNLPRAQQIHNIFRNQLLGARMQADGHNVIPNVRVSGRNSVPYALAGVPTRSTLAIGLYGCTKSRENRPRVIEEIRIICDACMPTNLVVYGSDAYGVLKYPLALGIPTHIYAPDSFLRSSFRKAA